MFRFLSMAICLALAGVLLPGFAQAAQKSMSVQVKESQVRAAPSYLGKIVGRTSYGAQVTVLEERGAWKKVSVAGGKTQGWMHATALSGKKIILKAGQGSAGTSVTQDEIALAGKGFSEEVEGQYRKNNKNLDYAWINRMETLKMTPAQMEDFIATGRLNPNGEGGRP